MMLVLVSLDTASHAERFGEILSGATTVLGAVGTIEVSHLGTFNRQARGKSEVLSVHVVKAAMAGPPVDDDEPARHLEAILKSMLAASALDECEVRVFAKPDPSEQP